MPRREYEYCSSSNLDGGEANHDTSCRREQQGAVRSTIRAMQAGTTNELVSVKSVGPAKPHTTSTSDVLQKMEDGYPL